MKSFFAVENISDTKGAYKKYFDIAWPAAAQGLLIDLMMAIDLAMVGSLGKTALATVGIMSQPKMVLFIAIRALSVPLTALVSRRKGEERIDEMNSVMKQGLKITALIYIPLVIMFLMFLRGIVGFAGAAPEIMVGAEEYGRYIVIGTFFAAFTQAAGSCLIGTGNTKTVFKANVAGNVINVCFNYFLIYGIWIFPELKVKGAGIATMIGHIVTFVIMMSAVSGKKELSLNSKSTWRFDKSTVTAICKLGGSSFGEQSFERFGMFAYTRMVAKLGVVAFATHHVCMNLCDIFYSFSMGLGYASASFTGQNIGKKKPELAAAYGRIGIKTGLVMSVAAGAIYMIWRTGLVGLYTNDEAVIRLGGNIMIITALAAIPQTFQLVYSGVLKGAGDTFYVMLYSLFVIAVFRPILTYLLCFTFGLGLYGAWIALLCDQSLRMIFSGFRFKTGKWRQIRL